MNPSDILSEVRVEQDHEEVVVTYPDVAQLRFKSYVGMLAARQVEKWASRLADVLRGEA